MVDYADPPGDGMDWPRQARGDGPRRSGPSDRAAPEGTPANETDEGGAPIRCAACKKRITTADRAIPVAGAHRHSFSNPAGFVFEIGCFSAADGCACHGRFTSEFTWFAGFAWRFALCGNCLTHLGWHYSSGSGSDFFGLIIDRLTHY